MLSGIAFVFFVLVLRSRAQQNGVPDFLTNGKRYNPGIEARITQRGLDYIISVAGRIANTVIPQLTIGRLTNQLPGIKGNMTIRDVHVSRFVAPDRYSINLIPPYIIKFSVTNLQFATQYKFDARILLPDKPLSFSGTGNADARNFNMSVLISFDRTPDGHPKFETVSCANAIGEFSLLMRTTGEAAELIETFKQKIEDEGKKLLSKQVCDEIGKGVDQDLNKQFQSLATIIPVLKPDNIAPGDSTDYSLSLDLNNLGPEVTPEIKDLIRKVAAHLFFDYRFIERPYILKDYVESSHKGEMSDQGKGGTPFLPYFMPPIHQGDRMLYMEVSDFVLNSLIFSAYSKGGLSIKVNQHTNPSLAKSLKTTCPPGSDTGEDLCFGNFFKALARDFPNHDVEVDIDPDRPPYVVVKQGVIQQVFDSKIKLFGRPLGAPENQRKFWISASVHNEAATSLWIKEKLHGNFTSTNVKVNVLENNVDKDSGIYFDFFAHLVFELIDQKINEFLRTGVTIPNFQYGRLAGPNLQLIDRTILLDADVELDEKKLAEKAKTELLLKTKLASNN